MDSNFYKGKTVLITGHTGFKGAWMCRVLARLGANVIGYALEPPTSPSLFELLNLEKMMFSEKGDIRDLSHLNSVFDQYRPEIVIHMAAQPIVRTGYEQPVYTYETNVMGTVNICEAIRFHPCVKSFVNVTTDKVYRNNEWEWGYREIDALDGYDPYSNSKSCSELVTSSYLKSFFKDRNIAISTCRAGNVIGGGDFAPNRIIPDCVRAQVKHKEIAVRNANSIRPYQHVLEPVCAYLYLAMMQYTDNQKYSGCYNIGPRDIDCISTGKLVDLFVNYWGEDARWINAPEENSVHESGFLKLDCSKAYAVLGWEPQWSIEDAVYNAVQWSKVYCQNGDILAEMDREIEDYLGE